ncbi:unnamed protein product [Trifolium pratense]|uniref:Uncharacterized protein n=1 Tax=Trifolium pratense TaxID=57577 RepID=A0ACB0IQW2_TRIPR|nr:unnamed protein product [Trifolium pratense]
MNESSETNPVRSYTGSSSFMVGEKRGYIDTLVVPTQSHISPSSNRLVDPPQESSEDIITPSSKKPRGRPLGSKNRPKPPPAPLTKIASFEIPTGMDIVGILINYARQQKCGITVVSGFGLISSVTFLDPVSRTPTFPVVGPFHMTSMFGTYVNPNCHSVSPRFIKHPICSYFSICLAGNGADVYGGIVGGQVITAGVVSITTSLFRTPEIHQAVSVNGGVFNNVVPFAPQLNNNNIVVDVPDFNVVDVDSTQPNHQMSPHHLPNDDNVMKWNHSTHTNLIHRAVSSNGGVINNVSHIASQPNNNDIVVDVPNFNVVDVDSTQPNHQMPPHHLPNDDNVMQWNHSTHTNLIHRVISSNGGVINNVSPIAPQPNNNDIVVDVPNFNVVDDDSTQPNHQMPRHHLPYDDNMMQWNHSTHTNVIPQVFSGNGGVINNFGPIAPQPNNNIVVDVPKFNVVDVNSTQPNHQMPPHHLLNDDNLMQRNHSTHTNAIHQVVTTNGVVINNVGHIAPQPNNNNIVVDVPNFNVVDVESTQPNHQMFPYYLHDDDNVMQWNHPTH